MALFLLKKTYKTLFSLKVNKLLNIHIKHISCKKIILWDEAKNLCISYEKIVINKSKGEGK